MNRMFSTIIVALPETPNELPYAQQQLGQLRETQTKFFCFKRSSSMQGGVHYPPFFHRQA